MQMNTVITGIGNAKIRHEGEVTLREQCVSHSFTRVQSLH